MENATYSFLVFEEILKSEETFVVNFISENYAELGQMLDSRCPGNLNSQAM